MQKRGEHAQRAVDIPRTYDLYIVLYSSSLLELEEPLVCVILLSLAGVNCIYSYQWHITPDTAKNDMERLLQGKLNIIVHILQTVEPLLIFVYTFQV